MMRLILFMLAFANYSFSFEIKSMQINCEGKVLCRFLKTNSHEYERSYPDQKFFLEMLTPMYSQKGFELFNYNLDSNGVFKINALEKKVVSRVIITGLKKKLKNEIMNLIDIKGIEHESSESLERRKQTILNTLRAKGYFNSKVGGKFVTLGVRNLGVYFNVVQGAGSNVLSNIKYKCVDPKLDKLGKKFFNRLIGKPYVAPIVNETIENFKVQLKSYGFYFAEPKLSKKLDNKTYHLTCGNLDQVIVSSQTKSRVLEKSAISKEIQNYLENRISEFSLEKIKTWFETYLEQHGFKANKLNFDYKKKINSLGLNEHYIKVIAPELKKVRVTEIDFVGNKYFSDSELRKLYDEMENSQIKYGVFVKKNFDALKEKIYDLYLNSGFLSPEIKINSKSNSKRRVRVIIREGTQSFITKLSVIDEFDKDITESFSKVSKMKEKQSYSPRLLEDGIRNFLKKLKSSGFSTAYLMSLENEVIKFSQKDREVEINFKVHRGKTSIIKSVNLIGLDQTKRFVIERKLDYIKGSRYSVDLVNRVTTDITSLGLFQNYKIKKLDSGKHTELLIEFEEKPFGLLEVSPGFRSDIGAKISSKLVRKNLWGRNAVGSLFGQLNFRPKFVGLNEYRQENSPRLAEYSLKSSLNYPDFFKTYWDSFSTLSFSRKRLFFVDADIIRLNSSLRKDINKYFSFSLGYQYENIRQFNASPRSDGEDDNGKFEVGGIVPSLVLDLRDDQILPSKGGQFQLTLERALPLLGSQSDDDLKINFTKFTSRNKVYLSISDSFYLASSISFGVQKNHASKYISENGQYKLDQNGERKTEGFIPSVKVFRLSGIDQVRGYAENEINNLGDSTTDVSEVAIRDKAFFTNLKFEPRYRYSESLVFGLFFDAGKVQKDLYRPFEMRSSVGLSVKYITPVGSLDFDYGHKIKRRTGESSGRFHLSIGFF